jgi:hypothetical protein
MIIAWMINQMCPDGVQLDVAITGQQISIVRYQARFIAPLKESTSPPILLIEIPYVLATDCLHHPGETIGMTGGGQKVYVVGHIYPGMYRHIITLGVFSQPMSINRPIIIAAKDNLSIVTTLNNVLGVTRRRNSGKSGHCKHPCLLMIL